MYAMNMKERRLTIEIEKPVADVFKFTVDPTNTPKWIDGIDIEETNETPPRLGTVYRNRSNEGRWNEYKMTSYKKDEMFELSRINGDYHVRYTFMPTTDGGCEFEYFEWVDTGELDDTFSQDVLEKLKKVIEEQV